MKPTLCRLFSYVGTGLPRPAMSSMTGSPGSGALGFAFGRCFVFLRLEASRCSDRGNSEVAVGDGRLHVFRQLDGGDVNAVAQIGAFEVDLDSVRNLVGRALRFDLVANDVQDTATLEASRLLFVDEANRDLDGDQRVLADAQKVHVDREVTIRVKLVGLGEDLNLLAVDFDRSNGGHEAAAVDLVVDI